MEELLTVTDVAGILKIHGSTVARLVSSGKLQAFNIQDGHSRNRQLRFTREQVQNFLSGIVAQPAPKPEKPSVQPRFAPHI